MSQKKNASASTKKSQSSDPIANFSQNMQQLEKLVTDMQHSDGIELEQCLQQFETGVCLIKQCQQALSQAEQKVHILIQDHTIADTAELQQFTTQNQDKQHDGAS